MEEVDNTSAVVAEEQPEQKILGEVAAAPVDAQQATADAAAPAAASSSSAPTATDKRNYVRVVAVFGYLGTRFQGLQKNPGAFAVEDEIERVLHEVGAISDRDYGDLHKIQWNRAARTDKGVHAAGQVVSFRMHLPPGLEAAADLVEKINAKCPPDLRCVDIARVINNFNAKNLCNSRQYEYLLPTFTLQSLPSRVVQGHLATHRRAGKPMSQAAKKAAAEAAEAGTAGGAGEAAAAVESTSASESSASSSSSSLGLLDPLSTNPFAGGLSSGGHLTAEERMKRAIDAGKDSFANGEAMQRGRLELASLHATYKHSHSHSSNSMDVEGEGAASASSSTNSLPLPLPPADFPSYLYYYRGDEGIAKASSSSSSSSSASSSAASTTSQPDKWQTGAGIAQGWQELRDTEEKRLKDIRVNGYRLSHHEWQRLSDLAYGYVGTKAYHNFTPRMTFGDASTVRFVMDCKVSKPFVIHGDGSNAAQAVPGSKSSSAAAANSTATSDESSPEQQQQQQGAGLEYVKFTIVGQSFLYNQIRHMVGLLVDIMRGAAPQFMMDRAFSVGVCKLPLAPAEGLYLSHCNFSGYDKKYTGPRNKHHGGALGQLRSLQGMPKRSHELFNGFKEGVIWRHIHTIITKDRPFHKYMGELMANPMSYRTHVPIQLIEILTRQQNVLMSGAHSNRGPMWAMARASKDANAGAMAVAAAAAAAALKQKQQKIAASAAAAEAAAASSSSAPAASSEAAVGEKRKRMEEDEEGGNDDGDNDDDDAPRAAADDDDGDDDGKSDDDQDGEGGGAAAAPAAKRARTEESSSAPSSSSSSAAAASRASNGPSTDDNKTFRQRVKENDSIVFSYILDHIDTLLLKPANTGLLSGVSVSKVAKEKADFKRKLKGELNEIRNERAAKREAGSSSSAAADGGGAGGAGADEDDGTGDQYVGTALRDRLQQKAKEGAAEGEGAGAETGAGSAASKPAASQSQGWRNAGRGGGGGGQVQTWRFAGGRGGGSGGGGGGGRGRGRGGRW